MNFAIKVVNEALCSFAYFTMNSCKNPVFESKILKSMYKEMPDMASAFDSVSYSAFVAAHQVAGPSPKLEEHLQVLYETRCTQLSSDGRQTVSFGRSQIGRSTLPGQLQHPNGPISVNRVSRVWCHLQQPQHQSIVFVDDLLLFAKSMTQLQNLSVHTTSFLGEHFAASLAWTAIR